MGPEVKPKRRYRSRQRALQAEATRRQILEVAARLFIDRGFFGTTVEAIAVEAGVAVPTIYASLGAKRAVLAELLDSAIAGDDPPRTVVEERSWYREIHDEVDARRLLHSHAANACRINARVAPLQRVVEHAADADAEVGALFEAIKHQRYIGQRAVAILLDRRGALRAGLTVSRAADMIWVLVDAHVYLSLVDERRWSSSQVAQWLGDTLCAVLL